MNLSKKQNLFFSLIIVILIILFIINPTSNLEACLNGIIIWGTAVAPALFPFLIFTKLLCELNFVENVSRFLSPITKKLYNTPGISAYIYTMSVLSGYPVGAKLTADFYEKGLITQGQAIRITTFTSTSGPLFIIGTVGIGMFGEKLIGITILISHFIGALINGLFYRNYMFEKVTISSTINYSHKSTKNMLEEIMLTSIKSILIVGGYVAIFFVIITILNDFNAFYPIKYILSNIFNLINIPTSTITPILNGLVEVTRGCLDLSLVQNLSFTYKTVITTFLISFGGFSIYMQAITFIKKFNIKMSFYLFQKFTHALISSVVAYLLCLIINLF